MHTLIKSIDLVFSHLLVLSRCTAFDFNIGNSRCFVFLNNLNGNGITDVNFNHYSSRDCSGTSLIMPLKIITNLYINYYYINMHIFIVVSLLQLILYFRNKSR